MRVAIWNIECMGKGLIMSDRLRNRRTVALLGGVVGFLVLAGCVKSPQEREARYLKEGRKQLAKKEYSRAILDFQNAAQANPKDAEPQYQLGLAYLTTRNLIGAAQAFRKATELNPQHWQANLKLTELLAATRNQALLTDAAARLHNILKTAPDNAEALDTLAITEAQQGRIDDAAKRLQETLAKFPAHLQSSVVLARLKLAQKDFVAAQDILSNAVAIAPHSPQAALALAQLYIVIGQPDKAEAEAARALQLDQNNAETLWTLASSQMAARRMDAADQTYKRIAALPDKQNQSAHALFLFTLGKQEEAVAEFEQIVKRDADDRQSRTQLIDTYLQRNQVSEAQKLLESALKRNPKDTDALFQNSEVSLRSGNARQAETDLRQVLRMRPNSAVAHLLLAVVEHAQGLESNARQELGEALKLDRRLVEARVALAASLVRANQPTAAVEVLDDAPASQKGTLALIVERNWALLREGQVKQVRAVLDRVLPVANTPELLLQDSLVKLQQHDLMGARSRAEEILRANPEEVRAARVVAQSLAAENQDFKAVKRLEEIVAARPKSAPLRELLGEWYASTGKLAESRAAFEAAKSDDLKSFTAEFALADLDRHENHLEAALQRMQRVVAAGPPDITAVMMLADIRRQTGNRKAAIEGYRSALLIDSSNLIALNNLAYLMAWESPIEALSFAQRAAEIAPNNAAVQDTLGWVYYRQGIYSSAVTYLKAAVQKDPTPQYRFHLAMSYLKSGDATTGRKLLSAAIQQDPELLHRESGW